MAANEKVGILVVHGMGAQKPHYSDELKSKVSASLGGNAARFDWEEIYWARVLEDREDKLWSDMDAARQPDGSKLPLDWQTIRTFVMHNFGDALAYHRDTQATSAYREIHQLVSTGITQLQGRLANPAAPIVVMAHSLGAHIMSNYLWDHQPPKPVKDGLAPLPTLAAMITFGCNIPLFSLAFSGAKPIDVPGIGVTKPALVGASRWLNFVDRDDVLGWPLRPLYARSPVFAKFSAAERRTVERIEDYEINVGNLVTAWNPAAHGEYWGDRDFTQPVADYLGKLLQALDA